MFFPSISLLVPNVFIGSLAMHVILFFLCMYAYCSRPSKNINRTLHLTLIVSIFGVLNTGLLLCSYYSYTHNEGMSRRIAITGLFFGLSLVPAIWMVGITLFSLLLRKPFLVLIAYFVTLVQFGLIVVSMASIGNFFSEDDGSFFVKDRYLYTNMYKTVISVNWIYFILFFALLMLNIQSIPRSVTITLILFGVLNTSRLLIETVLQRVGDRLEIRTTLYTLFFLTDFLSVISLYMTTLFWKNEEKEKIVEYALYHN